MGQTGSDMGPTWSNSELPWSIPEQTRINMAPTISNLRPGDQLNLKTPCPKSEPNGSNLKAFGSHFGTFGLTWGEFDYICTPHFSLPPLLWPWPDDCSYKEYLLAAENADVNVGKSGDRTCWRMLWLLSSHLSVNSWPAAAGHRGSRQWVINLASRLMDSSTSTRGDNTQRLIKDGSIDWRWSFRVGSQRTTAAHFGLWRKGSTNDWGVRHRASMMETSGREEDCS